MKFHPLCVAIIDTPQFQRLRNIKQLSTTYFVYPGASHNRFEHSLGVSYLAGLMVDALIHNTPTKISREEKLSVQIAGLCHDLGHGPFSHTWEKFLQRMGKHFEHENASEQVLEYLIDKNNLKSMFEEYHIDLKLINELIKGEGKILPLNKKYLYQIIANKVNDIDVDKWDYFLRDGHQLNLKITFDYRRLLSFCVVLKTKDGRSQIAFRNKEAANIFDMFRVRADLHFRAYQHVAVKNTELLLIDALVAANEHYVVKVDGGKEYKLSEAHTEPEALCKLTDHIQYSIEYSDDPKLEEAKKILLRLSARKLYTLLGQFKFSGDKDEFRMLEKELIKKFPKHTLVLSLRNINLGSTKEPFEKVVFYKKPTTSTRQIDESICFDKTFSYFPFHISKDLSQKELLLFSKSKMNDDDKTKVINYMNIRLEIPDTVKS